MIEDEVVREVRAAREAFAASHGYDIRAMVAALHEFGVASGREVVCLPPRRPAEASQVSAPDPDPKPLDSNPTTSRLTPPASEPARGPAGSDAGGRSTCLLARALRLQFIAIFA